MRWAFMSDPHFTLPINLYISCVVMSIDVDNNAYSACFISHARGALQGKSKSMTPLTHHRRVIMTLF